jgi:hypothetical protein
MTYPKFEEIWQSKFKDAQETPSEAVWEAIAWQVGYKERQRKKWIAWWAAALVAFFLGDGRLVYNFYGKLFDGNWQNETIAEINPLTQQEENKIIKNFLNKKTQEKKKTSTHLPEKQNHEKNTFFVAEAAYELAEEKVASKRTEKEVSLQELGKPKKRAFWLKNYAQTQYVQHKYTYKPTLLEFSRMLPNLQSLQSEQTLQKEIASFRHIFSWGVGAELGWLFHKNFYISSGLHYQKSLFSFQSYSQSPELAKIWGRLPEKTQDFSTIPTPTIIEASAIESSVSTAINEPVTYRFTQEIAYLTLPIKLGYQKIGHRWQYGVTLGIENSFLLNNTFKSTEETFRQVYQNVDRCQIVTLAEVSVGFRLNHKTTLHISPTFRKFLKSPFVQSNELQLSTDSFGVGAGLQIGL